MSGATDTALFEVDPSLLVRFPERAVEVIAAQIGVTVLIPKDCAATNRARHAAKHLDHVVKDDYPTRRFGVISDVVLSDQRQD